MKLIITFILIANVFVANFSYAGDDTLVEGRIFTEQGALPGAVAKLYKTYQDLVAQKPMLVSDPADKEGIVHLFVPPGQYYFAAEGFLQGTKYSSFHCNNPISIGKVSAKLGLMAVLKKDPVASPGNGVLKGTITFKGTPLKTGYVSAYHPGSKTFKGLGVKTVSLEADGTFAMLLPVGEYVITAKNISSSSGFNSVGPPQVGDLIGYLPSNPVSIKEGQDLEVEVPLYPKGDRGSFDDVTILEYLTDEFVPVKDLGVAAGSGIKGKVVDTQGKPIVDIFVLAYKTSESIFQMYHLSHGTEYIVRTDANGNFFIPLEESGVYYVVARDTLGNAPHRGEIYGLYQENPMHQVSFESGKVVDSVNIVAGVTMDDAEIYSLAKDSPQIETDLKIDSDMSITKDTQWSGNVLINGVVSVKRGVTLTIQPGTVVRFKWIDRDNNKIGDGEILVEGRIVAEGLPDKKIIFTSASEKPAARDWSYVNILSTGAENIFRYCIFEYGFSGMQLHYSNAKIYDSLFHKNGEGLHFNTVNMEAAQNTLINNDVGIRFSRLEGRTLISNNMIKENDIGVQFTHQHINAVDFENIHKVLEPPLFISNNIAGNRKYNFSMGDRQNIDIDLRGNWWGSDNKEKISSTIFDKLYDEELGEVDFSPHLTAPVTGAGIRWN